MPATYAPGPQTNAPNDTNRFWACQDPKHNMFDLNAPLPPTCWWITCGYLRVQDGHRLRKDCGKEGKTGLLNWFDERELGGVCGKVFLGLFSHLDALG